MIQIDKPMPEGCDVCPLMYDYIQCNALPEGCKDDDDFNKDNFDWTKRPDWCPLKEQEGFLGIQQTADSITFISTGTAQQGESRGLLLGKFAMHEWLKKELLYRGLLTDDIRAVFDEAKRQ